LHAFQVLIHVRRPRRGCRRNRRAGVVDPESPMSSVAPASDASRLPLLSLIGNGAQR